MRESDKDLLKNELKKLFPEIEQMDGILDQLELNVEDHKSTTYEVKEVNKQELEAIRKSSIGKDGRFEKIESNESRKNTEILHDIRNQLTALDEKMDAILHYLKPKG